MKKTLKIFAINILMLFFLLIIIDPFLTEKEVFRSVNDTRSVILKGYRINEDREEIPLDDNIKGTENLVQKPYRLRTDSNGFIIGNQERTIKHQVKDSINIIFFGGSTTECFYVDEDKRFPYLVGQILSDKSPRLKINTLNGGFSGSHSMHSTISLLAKGIPLNPKIVILMENVNDLSLLTKTGSYWKAPTTRSIIQDNEDKNEIRTNFFVRIKNFLRSTKDLLIPNFWSGFKKSLLIITGNNENESIDEWENYRQNNYFEYKTIKEQYKSSIRAFIRIAQAFNIEVVLMTQFNRLNPDDTFVKMNFKTRIKNDMNYELFCQYYKQFNNELRDIAKKENLLLIDLENQIPSNRLYIYDAVHLNNAGSELAANIISKELQKKYPYLINE